MHKFEDLIIGDMFNTMSGRWVKIFDNKAICVLSGMYKTGYIADAEFFKNSSIIVLFSSDPAW